jgi:hypothetical protein
MGWGLRSLTPRGAGARAYLQVGDPLDSSPRAWLALLSRHEVFRVAAL